MKLLPLLALLVAVPAPAGSFVWGQDDKPKPDVSLAESKKVSPFPPKSATVRIEDGLATVRWAKIPTEKITGYQIYRGIDGGPMKRIGRTKEPPFIDHPPANTKVTYAVAAIDSNDNESRLRTARPE